MTTLEEVADRIDLRALVDAYAVAVDARDRERFVGLFLPDAVMAMGPRELEGHEGVVKAIDMLDKHYPRSMHFVGNHDVTLDGDHATGLVYCLAHHISTRDEGSRDRFVAVHYDDRYVRTDDGWRFARRDLTIIWEEERPAMLG
jgi:uncharacterized protein (TIGR02246 family)